MKQIIALAAAGALAMGLAAPALAQTEEDEALVETDWQEYGEWFDASRRDAWIARYDRNQDGLVDEEVFEEHGLVDPDLEPRDLGSGVETNEDFLWGLFDVTE